MEQLFAGLPCSFCGGTVTKVSEAEAVCFNDEQHRRKIKFIGVANILSFDSTGTGGLSLAFYDSMEPIEGKYYGIECGGCRKKLAINQRSSNAAPEFGLAAKENGWKCSECGFLSSTDKVA